MVRRSRVLFDDDDDEADFFVLKFLHTHTVYSLGITIYIYVKGKFAEQKSYGFKNFVKLEVDNFFFEIKAGRTVFNFLNKTSCFSLVFSLFE